MKILSIFSLLFFINISHATENTDSSTPPRILGKTFTSQQELDTFVARRAFELFTEMNASSRFQFPEPGGSYQSNSLLWQKLLLWQEATRRNNFDLKLKPGTKPSVGLKDLFKEGGTLGCRLANQLVTHIILCELLSDKLFDSYYRQDFSLSTVDIPIIGIDQNKTIPETPGHFGYITNVANYPKLHPTGNANGENIFCVSTNGGGQLLYFGFGPLFKNGPKTLLEIEDDLYEHTILPSKNTDADCAIAVYKWSPKAWKFIREKTQNSSESYCFRPFQIQVAR